MRKEDFLIKAKHQAANDKLNSIFQQRHNVAAGQWVWGYDNKSIISGGGKHVLKAPTDESSRKSFRIGLEEHIVGSGRTRRYSWALARHLTGT